MTPQTIIDLLIYSSAGIAIAIGIYLACDFYRHMKS